MNRYFDAFKVSDVGSKWCLFFRSISYQRQATSVEMNMNFVVSLFAEYYDSVIALISDICCFDV